MKFRMQVSLVQMKNLFALKDEARVSIAFPTDPELNLQKHSCYISYENIH